MDARQREQARRDACMDARQREQVRREARERLE